ncbi:MAG: adenylate/guanylate cyclase domain-containing protein [Desulfomonilaceae bacterium]
MKTPTGLKKLNIKLTVILGFVLMVALIIIIAAMGYVALREAIEDATLYSALSRDTNLAHDIGNSMLILNGALGSYLANRDVQSVWEVDYRLALTRRMAKMAHKSNLNPELRDILVRVDDILATFNKNFNQLTELDAKLTQVQRTTPDNITEIKELAKQRQALQNLFQIAVIKVSHNVESARDAIKVQQESIDTRIQNSFRTTMVVAVLTVAAAIVIALVVALLFVRLITKPVGVLEQIVRRSPSIAFRFSAAPGRPVEYVSENVIEFGYSADDFYSGRVKLVDVLHPEDREIVARKLHYLTTAKSSDREFNQEYRIITSSGATCWLDERMWVVLNDKGDITHYEGIVIDITKRKLAEEQLEREQARRVFVLETFGSYLSDEIVAEILESPGGINLGGELREISILVSDLRGFTRITESMDSRKVLKILNRYLEVMTDIILRYSGTIDEFTGDGILVFFGAPRQFSDHSRRAVLCAIEMQKAMKALNEDNIKLGLPELSMGIGINCGELVVGNIGSNRRKKYGAVGTPINVAFRVQTQTIGGDILVTAPVYERVSSNVVIGPVREAVLKGIEGLVTIYQVIGVGKN